MELRITNWRGAVMGEEVFFSHADLADLAEFCLFGFEWPLHLAELGSGGYLIGLS